MVSGSYVGGNGRICAESKHQFITLHRIRLPCHAKQHSCEMQFIMVCSNQATDWLG